VIQAVDSGILHEIVRIVGTRSKVPVKVRLRGKEYQLTYLDDHKQRLEDALHRHDPDRLNMLYGQLASKVKYQLLRQVSVRRSSNGGKRSVAPEKRRSGLRTAPGRMTRTPRPAKGKGSAAKSKAQSVKKRRAVVKKSAVAKKPATSRAARR